MHKDQEASYYYGSPDHAERRYARDAGMLSARRASTWTAAALIAAVAATTGYLAHSIPGPSTSAGPSGSGQPAKSTVANRGAPAVNGPVVTSGGSGVTAGSGARTGDR